MIIFIPIKEESQRVPNKNFRDFGGVPLWKNFLYKFKEDKVFVDTDSDKLISEIRDDDCLSNVVPYKRCKDLVGNEVSVCKLLENFINKYKIKDKFVQLHVTNPFLKRETVLHAFDMMDFYDSIVSCNKLQTRLWRKELYGYTPVNHNPLKLEQTQDLPELLEENSCFYVMDPSVFKRYGRIGENPHFYEVVYPENLDIDTEQDWAMCVKVSELET